MLPAQPDRQLCRIALAAAHIPAAAYADGADIERVLAAFQYQCCAAALLHRAIAVHPVLGELHVRLQLRPAMGPGPAAFDLGDGDIRILAAVQRLCQQRHFTRGARAVITARHAAANRKPVVPLALRIQSIGVATQACTRLAIVQPRIQPLAARRGTQHHMLAELPIDAGHQCIAVGADLVTVAITVLLEHLAATRQPCRSTLATHRRQLAAKTLADALFQVVVVQQHCTAGCMHFTGELVERVARGGGVVGQQRVVQAQRRAGLRQAVQRRCHAQLVAGLRSRDEGRCLLHIDLQLRGIRCVDRAQ
ncbi:hypothetical protein D3C81_1355090 [compost metagenome]